jgi:hypothetical protein
MNAKHLFGSYGQFIAFVDRWNVFAANGSYIGFVREDRVYRPDGSYLATIVNDRLLLEPAPPKHRVDYRPLPPHSAAPIPVDPFGRAPIVLPAGFSDVRL